MARRFAALNAKYVIVQAEHGKFAAQLVKQVVNVVAEVTVTSSFSSERYNFLDFAASSKSQCIESI